MKTIFKVFFGSALLLVIAFVFNNCVEDEYDEPEPFVYEVDFEANTSIADLKALYDGDTTLISDSIIIKGTVISTDKNGNFYKELVIQDSSGGISISIDRSPIYNDYPYGTAVYVKCAGLYLGEYGGVVQLGSLYEDNGIWQFGRMQGWEYIQEHLYRDDRGEPVTPQTITIPGINTSLVNTLVKFENVQFTEQNLGLPFADAVNNLDKNRDIEDCDKNSVSIRTSGYANFAADTVPSGKGTLIAVLGSYNNEYQLKLNSLDDVDMDGERCIDPNVLSQDFATGFDDWIEVSVEGDQVWEIASSFGNPAPCATISGYDDGNYANEDWLISPAFNANEHETLLLSFETACNYIGSDLEIYISTDYSGSGNPNNANWTQLSAELSSGSWNWKPSGDIDISSYNGANVYVGFKYTSSTSTGKTWEIDNIKVTNPDL